MCGNNGAAWSSGGRVRGSQPADAMDLSLLAREVHVEGTDLARCGVSREHTAAAPQAVSLGFQSQTFTTSDSLVRGLGG